MMGEMKENLRDGLIEASVHLVNREFDSLAGDFVTLGYVMISLSLFIYWRCSYIQDLVGVIKCSNYVYEWMVDNILNIDDVQNLW